MTPTLNVVGLTTSDMTATLAFYRRLGLDIPASADAEPHVHVAVSEGFSIAFDTLATIRGFDPGWASPGGSPRMNLAFQCGAPDEVDRVYADMTGAGHHGHREPWDADWGMRYALLRDPDGNGVDLYAALPG